MVLANNLSCGFGITNQLGRADSGATGGKGGTGVGSAGSSGGIVGGSATGGTSGRDGGLDDDARDADDGDAALDLADADPDATPDGQPDWSSPDGGEARTCSVTSRFGTPVLVPVLNDLPNGVGTTRFTADERVAYLGAGPVGQMDILMLQRETRLDSFGPVTNLRALNGPSDDGTPALSDDGLTLYMQSNRSGGGYAIYVTSRANAGDSFLKPVLLEAAPGPGSGNPFVTGDGNRLYFHSYKSDTADLWLLRKGASGFGAPERLAVSTDSAHELAPIVSPDELTLYYYYEGSRAEANGIWMATRTSVEAPFADARHLSELDNPEYYPPAPSWVSPDGCRLYYTALDGEWHLWLFVAERLP